MLQCVYLFCCDYRMYIQATFNCVKQKLPYDYLRVNNSENLFSTDVLRGMVHGSGESPLVMNLSTVSGYHVRNCDFKIRNGKTVWYNFILQNSTHFMLIKKSFSWMLKHENHL